MAGVTVLSIYQYIIIIININRLFGYERVPLLDCKVEDTPFSFISKGSRYVTFNYQNVVKCQ